MSQQPDTGVLFSVHGSDLRGSNGSSIDLLITHTNSVFNILSLIFMSSGFIILLLGFYAYRRYLLHRMKVPKHTASSTGSFHSIFGRFPSATNVPRINFVEKEETMHLMSNASMYDNKRPDEAIVILSSNTCEEARRSFSSKKNEKCFRDSDLEDGNDTMLMLTFMSVMSMGLFINLHTTYGARMVCMTIVGDEVRWQAIRQSSSKVKRYKLNLSDVMSVQMGKQPGQLQTLQPETESRLLSSKNIFLDGLEYENFFFSLVTQKTSLYLEAASVLERDSLIRGFKLRLEILQL